MITSTVYTDFSEVVVDGKKYLRVGTPIEWAALVRAGYLVNSHLRPVRGRTPTFSLGLLVPELGRFVAKLRDESIGMDISLEEYVEYCDRHSDFFEQRRSQNSL